MSEFVLVNNISIITIIIIIIICVFLLQSWKMCLPEGKITYEFTSESSFTSLVLTTRKQNECKQLPLLDMYIRRNQFDK